MEYYTLKELMKKQKTHVHYNIYLNTSSSHLKIWIGLTPPQKKIINKIIDSLKSKKSSGHDEITTNKN
jgi:hypothetical protein